MNEEPSREKPYTLWVDYGQEGWKPRGPFATAEEALAEGLGGQWGGPKRITREVFFEVEAGFV